jgi:hypothetical protein
MYAAGYGIARRPMTRYECINSWLNMIPFVSNVHWSHAPPLAVTRLDGVTWAYIPPCMSAYVGMM